MRPRRTPCLAIVAALGLTACASTFDRDELARAPAWFKARQQELAGGDYPSLTNIPTPSIKPTDAARWAATERELRAAGALIEASPRGQPAPPSDSDADAFDKAARAAIDQARPAAGAPAAEPARPQ